MSKLPREKFIIQLEKESKSFNDKHQKFLDRIPELKEKISSVCRTIERSWSGSFSGHHGSFYYGEFKQPPFNKRFSAEWGTVSGVPDGWKQRDPDEVKQEIEKRIGGNFSIEKLKENLEKLLESAKDFHNDILDIIGLTDFPKQIERINATAKQIKDFNFGKPREKMADFINNHLPKTRVSRDLSALTEGTYLSTHLYCEAIAHEGLGARKDILDFLKLVKRLIKELGEVVPSLIPINSNVMETKLKNLHPEIYSRCQKLYNDASYAEAVEKSFKIVRDRLRSLTGYERGSEAFGKGKLYIRGAAASNVDSDFNKAVKFLTMAIDFFRNEKSHTADGNIRDPLRAYEYLRLSSLAMHLLDNAEILSK